MEVGQELHFKDSAEKYHQSGSEDQAHIRPASKKNGMDHIQPAAMFSAPMDFERPEQRNRRAGEQSIGQDVREYDRCAPEETRTRGR